MLPNFTNRRTFAVTVKNKLQEKKLIDFVEQLGLEFSPTKVKPLTTKQVALGIGRNLTDEELSEYINRTYGGEGKSAEDFLSELKISLKVPNRNA